MRALSLGVVAALMAMRAMGQEPDKDSAGYVAGYCRDWLNRDPRATTESLSQGEGACIGKIRGVLHVVDRPVTNNYEVCLGSNKFVEGFCAGQFEAFNFMFRSLSAHGYSREANGVCLPDQFQKTLPAVGDQVVRTVVGYIEARPGRIGERFEILSAEALHNAWPCNP